MNDRLSNSVIPYSGQASKGFTLVEVLFAVLLVGLSIAGLTAANYAYSQANGAAVDISTAEYLAEQIRELTATKSITEIPQTSWRPVANAPVNAQGTLLPAEFSIWTQQVSVQALQADLSTVDTGANPSFYRVTVRILKGSSEISSSSWIRARY
jgi:prepilin-type N-terminal cleavage/methylation domain-containing protein